MTNFRYKFPPARILASEDRKRAVRGRRDPKTGESYMEYESIGHFITIETSEQQRISILLGRDLENIPVVDGFVHMTLEFEEPHDG